MCMPLSNNLPQDVKNKMKLLPAIASHHAGAGKSSLIGLLLRLVQATTGRILIDGCDVSHVGLQRLRKAVGYVPQTPFVFEVRSTHIE